MFRRYVTVGVVLGALWCVGWTVRHYLLGTGKPVDGDPATAASTAADNDPPIGDPLYPAVLVAKPTPPEVGTEKPFTDPVIIPDCRLTVSEKEDVPSQRDGVIWIIGTEVGEGEKVPDDLLIRAPESRGGKRYRRLREGDLVKSGQLLAQLDDRLARDARATKHPPTAAAKADYAAAESSRNEARNRLDRGVNLVRQKAMSPEDLGERRLILETKVQEAKVKEEGVNLAVLEANQAQTTVGMHEIRSSIDGIIKTIYKNPGEAVKSAPSYEPVFQILNLNRLRIEGLMDEQHLPKLRLGDEVNVEATVSQAPEQILVGHLQEVTGVAVTRDSKFIVSASLDGTVRVWERAVRRERRILHHPGAILAVACTPAAEGDNRCVTGSADGSVRVWDLNSSANSTAEPMRTIAAAHRGAINSVAFSPDGAAFATGGDDREIGVWDAATGTLKYRLLGHSGAVTSVAFTPQTQLVSAGRDNTIRVWSLGTEAGRLENTLSRRSGDVAQPGVSPDGKTVLFDPWQSKALRLLSLPDGLTEAVLEEPSGAARLTTFALFAPDGEAIVTAGGADARLQLWQPPGAKSRPHVRRYLVSPHRATPNCAAFAPDSGFLAVGMRDRHILVFPRNCPEEHNPSLNARITHIERALDSHQVRVWAVLDNPSGRLLPGATVTMVRYPK